MSLEAFTSVLTNLLHFLIVLGLAVVFHEWGHFIVAKLLGAKVERFAVGFGKKIASYTWHDTEYAICALPLGGYVKITGMDPEDELTGANWEFLQLSPFKRILIVIAGPLMNFVLAYLIYVIILMSFGQAYTATTTIGHIPVGSIAWEMGLRDGDRVVMINGKEVNSWEEVYSSQNDPDDYKTSDPSQDYVLNITVERDGQLIERSHKVPPILLQADDKESELTYPDTFTGVFVTNVIAGGVAEREGILPGTIIKSIDGQEITTRDFFSEYASNRYQQNADGQFEPLPITLEFLDTQGQLQTITLTPDLVIPAEDAIPYQPKTKIDLLYTGEMSVKEYLFPLIGPLGVAPKLPPVVGYVQEGAPAQFAGITKGSRIVEINDQPVDDWVDVLMAVQDTLQTEGETVTAAPMEITWLTPNNEMKSATVTPNVTHQNILTPTSVKTGKRYAIAQIGLDMQMDRQKMGVLGALVGGWNRLWGMCVMMVGFIVQLFTGEVSPKLLGGPLAIFQLSGETGRWGLERFLSFIALLSANLGILNLFPIPPLDGGHIVMYTYEMIRRKPMSMKQLENFGKVGFILIVPLMLYLIFNDLSRTDLFAWIKGFF